MTFFASYFLEIIIFLKSDHIFCFKKNFDTKNILKIKMTFSNINFNFKTASFIIIFFDKFQRMTEILEENLKLILTMIFEAMLHRDES